MDKKGYSINNNKYNKSPKKEETAQSFKNSQENPPKNKEDTSSIITNKEKISNIKGEHDGKSEMGRTGNC